MSGIQISKKEIEDCEEAVKDFRVNELHQLVGLFKYPKIGKKQELVNRAVTILNNPKYQLQAVQKVREIQTNSRLREAAAMPYAPQSNNGMSNQMANGMTNNAMHQQQPQQHNAYHHPNMNAGGNMLQPSSIPNAYSNFMNATAAFSLAAYGQHLQGQFQHHLGGYAAAQQQAPPHQLHQSQQQHVIPNMQHSSGGLVKNLRTVELPFYDVKKVILPMTELPSYPVPTRPGEGRFSCHFGVAAEDIPRVTYPESQELPRYEIQLRVFLLETSEEQQDAFPPGSVVRLDDFMVNLPGVIPTNKPNAEQKRYPRPVNLTPYCRPARARDRPHQLIFEWNGDKRAWAFQILLVHRQNSDILFKRMRQNPQSTRPKESTKEVIIRRLNGADEDDVQMDTLKISLTDPLMKTRMKVPARAVDCTHLQTFDLNNYLMMNEKRPEWKCPVCTKKAYYSKLIIEEYFECMLKEVGPSVEEVELLRDGTWRLVQQNKVVSLDSDEDGADEDGDIMVVKNPAKGEKKKASAEPSAGPPKIEPQKSSTSRPAPIMATVDDDSIICLSSDDDEDEQIANAIAASNIRGGRGGSSSSAAGTPNSNSNSASNNVAQNAHWPNAGLAALLNGHNGSGGSGGSTPAMPPELQMNGHQQQIFRPIIEETAKTQIAKHLALFLQDVYSKNNQLAANCVTNSNNYH